MSFFSTPSLFILFYKSFIIKKKQNKELRKRTLTSQNRTDEHDNR